MFMMFKRHESKMTQRVLSSLFAFIFIFSSLSPYAAAQNVLNLPVPGTMVSMTPAYAPPIVRGLYIYPDNPLKFDFLVDSGNESLPASQLENESMKLIKYFLAALTIPEDQMWVNLSPYEKNRIIPEAFGTTEMGRDMLAQDYMLKQLTASLMYPEKELGSSFWNRVYQKAQEQYGTTEIPMNTFNKIWIVPESAEVYEHDGNVFVTNSYLKVMLEEDYLALESNAGSTKHGLGDVSQEDLKVISGVSSEVVRDLLIPEIEKEVNEGETFANLRQIYNSVILATWYKQNLQESLLGQVYVNQNKTAGVNHADKNVNQKIYDQYIQAFQQGVFDLVKEDYDPGTQQIIPRKYFSGGVAIERVKKILQDAGVNESSRQEILKEIKNLNRITVENREVALQNLTTGVLAQRITSAAKANTGELNVKAAKRAGANGAIAGHSEARQNLGDTDEIVNEQLKTMHAEGLRDKIFAFGEPLQVYEANSSQDFVLNQIKKGLEGLSAEQVADTIFAYEPIWAIGTGKTATPEYAQSMAQFIRAAVNDLHGKETADKIRIIYGGSVDAKNSGILIQQFDIDGFLVGGASNESESIQAIINTVVRQGPTNGRIPYVGGNNKTKKISRNFYTDMAAFLKDVDNSRVQVGFAPSVGLIREFADALVDVRLASSPMGQPDAAVLQNLETMAAQYPLHVTSSVAARLTKLGLRGAYGKIEEIINSEKSDREKHGDVTRLFEQLNKTTEGHAEIAAAVDILKRRDPSAVFNKDELKKFASAVKDTSDAYAKRIFVDTIQEQGIIAMVKASEGFGFGGRDKVEESLRSNEVVVPTELIPEAPQIQSAIDEGAQYYYSENQRRFYLISDLNVDVIEGTNPFVGLDKRLDAGEDAPGGMSTMTAGLGVRSLGNVPDGYMGQFFANLGSKSNADRFNAQRVAVIENGTEVSYQLKDPELYAKHPEKIINYLQFLAEIRGQQLEDLKEKIVVMKRDREAAFVTELRKLQDRIPGLVISGDGQTGITDGTVPHGLKALMNNEMVQSLQPAGVPFGQNQTMITVGGSAEAFMVLGISGAMKESGAVGGVRIYSALMNKDATGATMKDQSQRYQFSNEEASEFQKLRPEDAQMILQGTGEQNKPANGRKLFTEEDVRGDVLGVFSFINNDQVFNQPGTRITPTGDFATQVLRMGSRGGQVITDLITDTVSSSPMSESNDKFTKGGIDLNPTIMDLKIKRDGTGVPLPVFEQPVGNLQIDGFMPVIINVAPVTNLPVLLGVAEEDNEKNSDISMNLTQAVLKD